MSNHITIELCEEDRARIDRLTGAVEARIRQVQYCIDNGLVTVEDANISTSDPTPDPLTKKLSAIVANAAEQKTEEPAEDGTEAPQEATEAAPPTEDTPPWEENPTAAENDAAPTAPSVTFGQIRQKTVQLCVADGGQKKAQVREIINLYGEKVSDLESQPEIWGEVWGKLTALEAKA